MTSPPKKIRYDATGAPIRVPPRSNLTYDEFADIVDDLTPLCCAYPTGWRTDKKSGKPCCRPPASDDGCCEMHAAKKAAKSNRMFRSLPASTRKKAACYSIDERLLEMQNDIAIFSARTEEKIRNLGTGESRNSWQRLGALFETIDEAMKMAKQAANEGDNDAAAKWNKTWFDAFTKARSIVQNANSDEETWAEVLTLMERTSVLKQAEARRRVGDEQQAGSAEVAIASAVIGVIMKLVPSRADQETAAKEINSLFGTNMNWGSNQELPPDAEKPPALTVEHYLGNSSDEPEQTNSD